MKKSFIVAAVFAAIALFYLVNAVVILVPSYKTEAVVDFIGLPAGAVFGTYTDESGAMHSEERMFPTLLLAGNHIGLETVERFYGREINIYINPSDGKIYYAPHLYAQMIPFAVISLFSVAVGAVSGYIQRKKKATHT